MGRPGQPGRLFRASRWGQIGCGSQGRDDPGRRCREATDRTSPSKRLIDISLPTSVVDLRSATGLSIFLLVAGAGSESSIARGLSDIKRHALTCGGSRFTTMTQRDAKHDLIVQQMLWVQPPGSKRRLVPIPSAEVPRAYGARRIGKGPSRWIEGWACRRTIHHQFVEVFYNCDGATLSDALSGRYCSATSEWSGYVTLDGTLLDDGYTPDDPRYRTLERQLGLPDGYGSTRVVETMRSAD